MGKESGGGDGSNGGDGIDGHSNCDGYVVRTTAMLFIDNDDDRDDSGDNVGDDDVDLKSQCRELVVVLVVTVCRCNGGSDVDGVGSDAGSIGGVIGEWQ